MSQAAFYQTIPESNNVAIDQQGVRYLDPNPVQYVMTPAPLLTPVNPFYNQPQKVVYVREESPDSQVVYIKRTPRPRVTIITPDPKDRRVYTVMEDDDDEEEYDDEEEEEEDEEVIYIRRTPSRKVYQVKESYDDVPARVDTFRAGYKSIGGDVEIFDEKKTLKSKSKVDSFNKKYVRTGGDVEIFDEPINHRIKSRVESYNYGYAPKGGDVEIFDDKSRPNAKPKIFDEKLSFRSGPRVDTRNTSYSRNGGNVEVFSERPNFSSGPRIDTFNKNYVRQGGNVRVFSEKIDVNATPRVDDRNLNYKKLGGNVQVFSEKVEVRNIDPVVDTKNPNYRKPASNVKIFSKKAHFEKGPVIDSKNSEYRKPDNNVKIFNEKVEFKNGPVVDDKNSNYKKPESDVKIFNQKVEFNNGPVIDAKNKDYRKPESDVKIFNQKVDFISGPLVDAKNPDYQKPESDIKIFDKKIEFNTGPLIDSKNNNYKKSGGDVKIFDEKVEFHKAAMIDHLNKNYKKPDPKIVNQKIKVNAQSKIDNKNTPFVKTKNENKPDSNAETTESNQLYQNEPISEQSEKQNDLDHEEEIEIVQVLDNKDNVDFELEPVSKPKNFKSPENADDQETSALKQTRNHQKNGENKISRKKKDTNNQKRRIGRSNSPQFSSKVNEQKMAPKKKPVVEQTLKILENLGFKDPNVKNVKSKVTTWNSIENMHPTKPHLSYLNQYRTRDLQMSPDSKVKKWLSSSVPQSPTEKISIDDKKTQKKKENVLPIIKTKPKNPRQNDELPKQKKSSVKNASPRVDQWVQEDSSYNRNRTYDKNSKLPQISNKQMYEMVNTLTNRKPVKIAENDDIFDKFKTAKEKEDLAEPLTFEETLADEKETQHNSDRPALNE
ncbi:microtubule-associated 4 isoform X13 [Brachionus plicatilis]|uniref:Microtubule-associated 4 isoform X13 n=1 Tax=Brachionus plicatilis TaxID=10195 RepID=A0A3M7RM19_BRAPC|nr:microtubule-associated 4 isoform X13 [Brachionus plicatilis]